MLARYLPWTMHNESYPDHFSGFAKAYSAYRPGYPDALYTALSKYVQRRERCWDCGTGSGQAAVALAAHFERVVATDASAEQLEHALPHPDVDYRCARAEASGLEDSSIDLTTVAAALHWFELETFYAEVRRVSRPGAVLAAWSYGEKLVVNDAVTECVERLADDIVGSHWPPQFVHIRTQYRDLPFPFRRIELPAQACEAQLDFEGLISHVHTWSGVQRYLKAEGRDPLEEIMPELRRAWFDGLDEAKQCRTVRWPLHALVGYVE